MKSSRIEASASSPSESSGKVTNAAFTGTKEFRKLVVLTGYFVVLALLFYSTQLGQYSWNIILLSALAWFGFEARGSRKRIPDALKVGAFLLVFDFVIENSGWLMGLWYTQSDFAVGVVPLQVMGVAFFGGAAWALYLPKRFNLWHSLVDSLVFASFGALGERLLIGQVLFVYQQWWTSLDAFIAYFLTWVVLHYVRYGLLFRNERRQAGTSAMSAQGAVPAQAQDSGR